MYAMLNLHAFCVNVKSSLRSFLNLDFYHRSVHSLKSSLRSFLNLDFFVTYGNTRIKEDFVHL